MRLIVIFLILFSLWICVVPFSHCESVSEGDIKKTETTVSSSNSSNSGLMREGISAMAQEVGIVNPLTAVKRTANEAARSIGRSLGQYVRGQYLQIKNTELLTRFDNSLAETMSGLPLNSEERSQMIYDIQQAYIQDAEKGAYKLDQSNFNDLPKLVRKSYSEIVLKRTPEGIIDTYDEKGNLKTRWTKQNGALNGPAITYYPNGEIHYIDVYEQGWKINRKKYDEEGQLIFEQNYDYQKKEAAPAQTSPRSEEKNSKPADSKQAKETEAFKEASDTLETLPKNENVRKIPVVFVDSPSGTVAARQ